MTDTVDPETRSRIMRAVKSRDTRPELALRRALHEIGVRGYRVNAYIRPPYQYRTADLLFHRARILVFVDGCFWHKCPEHYKPSAQGRWRDKIDYNNSMGEYTRARAVAVGWTVLAFWEHELSTPEGALACAMEVGEALRGHVGRHGRLHTAADAARAVAALGAAGIVVEVFGSVATRGSSTHDIDVIVRSPAESGAVRRDIVLTLRPKFTIGTDWGGLFLVTEEYGNVDVFFEMPGSRTEGSNRTAEI